MVDFCRAHCRLYSLDWTNWPINHLSEYPAPHIGERSVASNHGPQGLATSEDGLHWQRACNGQPVMSPGEGDFDALFVVSWRQIRWIFRGAYGGENDENMWNTGCGDVWGYHVEDLWSPGAPTVGWLCWSCSLRRSLDSTADMTVRGIAWCWAVREWSWRRWNHRGGPFQSVPKNGIL